MREVIEWVGTAVVAAAIFCGTVLLVGVLIGFPIKWLWNWLMPDLFGLKLIGFWQAWGLALLSGCLFKSSTSSKKD